MNQLPALAGVFAYLSLLTMGGGMAAFPELKILTVDVHHWLTFPQLIHLYSVGQMAPGPNMMMVASLAPQRTIAFRLHPFTEVELAEVQEHFLDDGLVHQLDHVAARPLERRQTREETHEGRHGRAVRFRELAHAEQYGSND